MKLAPCFTHARVAHLPVVIFILLLAALAVAVPFHQPTIDGSIKSDGTDWDPADLVVDDSHDDKIAPTETAKIKRLWCTWDQDNLYLGMTFQDFGQSEAFALYVDLDRGIGPQDGNILAHNPGNYQMTAGNAFELVLGRGTLDTPAGPPPIAYLVLNSSGSMTLLDPQVTSAQQTSIESSADNPDKALVPYWSNAEVALPWDVIYPGQNGMVPANAVIKLVGVSGHAHPDSNGWDSAPDNSSDSGAVIFENMSPSVIDADGDGIPDASDATISGTVTLPLDPGDVPITVTAELIDFAGRDPGAPLSSVTTDDSVRTWTLPRLPAGRYRVTTSALGYFASEFTVDVAQSQAVTGQDQTLEKATTIGGTVSFEPGDPDTSGVITLKTADGTVVQTLEKELVGGPYTFFVEEGGDYVVEVAADTYFDADIPVTVVTGEDQTSVDFLLTRQIKVSGSVVFLEGDGEVGTIYFLDSEGNELGASGFSPSANTFEFFTPTDGVYTLSANTNRGDIIGIYAPTSLEVQVTGGQDVTGIELGMLLAAYVTGTVFYEGPQATAYSRFIDVSTGVVMAADSVSANGDTVASYLGPGSYRLELESPGYVPQTHLFSVSEEDTSLGRFDLIAVRATHLVTIDADGDTISSVLATKYDPESNDFKSSKVLLAARDDAGLDDRYDLEGRLQNFKLSALKMDDVNQPTGTPVFYRDATQASVDSVTSFTDGRADFYMSNTAVEYLRVYLAQPDKAPIDGRIIVNFRDPEPSTVLLTTQSNRDTLTADDVDMITVQAKLFDSAGKESKVPNIPVTFSIASNSSGRGQFTQPTDVTNSDGEISTGLTATGAGDLFITATVVINGRVLEVEAYELESGEEILSLVSLAGPTAGWDMSLPSNLSDLVTPVTVNAQTIDQFGNPTRDAGQSITFSATPANLGSFAPVTAVSDATGRATSYYTPSGTAGLVTFAGTSTGFTGDDATLRLRDLVVIPDPVWYDEPEDRQTLEQADLTALVIANTPEELVLEIPFQSDLNGMQIHVLFESNFDAAGLTTDPFEQPVNYGHTLLPDMVLTSKYSANDYGDIRRFHPGSDDLDYWNTEAGEWNVFIEDPNAENPNPGSNIQQKWVTKSADGLVIRVPMAIFGTALPDSILFEAYLTRDDVIKYSAFDSAPQDSTLNLTFDPDDPDADWDAALEPVTLEAYGRTYVSRTDFPTPPQLTNIRVTPEELDAGQTFVLQAIITDAGDGIGDVVADLSAMGGGSEVRMYDDGEPNHGDSVAGDGDYGLLTAVPITNPGGVQDLVVVAFDGGNILASRALITIDVKALITPIIEVTDEIGDDHGPNQPGTQNKFYIYPTNIAFVAGAFDLTGLTVYETKALVGGELIDMIAFQVSMVDFPDPDDPGTADWSPPYADLNITKIDILIDNAPGGATATLPWRQAAFQPWDAWDWAIIMDGWYKALIPSYGQNTVESWRDNALSNDQDILLISDPHLDTVTALVSKAAMGNPTAEDIAKWDIAVCMASHDFGGEEVLGGVRWVEGDRSEWQFGGGQSQKNGSGGDRDSNYMDLLMAPGLGHTPGAAQDSLLDYESTDALERLENGLMPVTLEITTFEDTGPPVIDTGGEGTDITQVAPLLNAPLAMALKITDDNRVAEATFRYRSTGFQGDGWDREVPMGYLGQDNWIVDILPSWMDSNLVYSPIDSTRYLEFEVEASDPGNDRADPPVPPKTSISPVTTLQIMQNSFCRPEDTTLEDEDALLLQVDGSLLNVPSKLRNNLVIQHFEQVWTGEPVDPDTMGAAVELQWDICNIQAAIKNAPRIPDGNPLGVFRQIFLATTDSLGGYLDYQEKIPGNAQLSLHYPQDWVPEGLDENLLAMYKYNPESNRWLLVGGNVTPTGNNVTATVNEVGTYGLFYTEANAYDPGLVISGITISPNPFSPNEDGLYDDTKISFFLTQEATITVEVYNLYGDRKNILVQTFPFSGSDITDPVPRRIPGLIWDGTDFGGNPVPYGIYILRILATYNLGGGSRTIRSSHPVAVIR